MDSWSRGKANVRCLSFHFVAWTLCLLVITNPALHKVVIHACCPSRHCAGASLQHYLPKFINHQAQRQSVFWVTCLLLLEVKNILSKRKHFCSFFHLRIMKKRFAFKNMVHHYKIVKLKILLSTLCVLLVSQPQIESVHKQSLNCTVSPFIQPYIKFASHVESHLFDSAGARNSCQ